MVTCTTPPFRAAVRLNSGVRRFLSGFAAVIAKSVHLEPPDPRWAEEFLSESAAIADLLGASIKALHHIGSTAIPGMYAKPIIDMLGVTPDLTNFDNCSGNLQNLKYEGLGEFGIDGRRYFRKNNPSGVRTHHLHVFQDGSPQIARHLAFRDYLTAHASAARDYEALKLRLAADFPNDIRLYTGGKDQLVREIDTRAAAWSSKGSA